MAKNLAKKSLQHELTQETVKYFEDSKIISKNPSQPYYKGVDVCIPGLTPDFHVPNDKNYIRKRILSQDFRVGNDLAIQHNEIKALYKNSQNLKTILLGTNSKSSY